MEDEIARHVHGCMYITADHVGPCECLCGKVFETIHYDMITDVIMKQPILG